MSELFEEITDERLEAYRLRVLDAHLGTVLGMYIKHEGGVRCASCGFTTHEGYQYTGIGEVCFNCGVRLTLRGMIKRIDSAESKLSFVEDCFQQMSAKTGHSRTTGTAPAAFRLIKNAFDRWVIVHGTNDGLAWSGSRWVPHDNGIPTGDAQICNFTTREEALTYANAHAVTPSE